MESLTSKWIKLMQMGHYCGCHQLPERSFFIHGYQFPLCASCTGMLVGEILTFALLPFKILVSPLLSIVLLGVMGFDWFLQFIKLVCSTNIRRFITGIMGGIGITAITLHFMIQLVKFIIRHLCGAAKI